MNRKTGELLFIFAFLTLFSTTLVSAGPIDGIRDLLGWSGEIIIIIMTFIAKLILNINTVDEFLFAKFILFSIVALMSYTILKRNHILRGNRVAVKIISILVGILSIRFLTDDLIQFILLPYSTLGVALTTFLPIVIYFSFIYQSDLGSFARKLGIVVFGIAFAAIWWYRRNEVADFAAIAYGIGLVAVVLALILDSPIKRLLRKFGFRRMRRSAGNRRLAMLEADLARLEDAPDSEYVRRERRRIEDAMERIIDEID